MSLSTYSENLLLNFLLNTQTATRPTAWYVQLHMSDPTSSGVGGTQPAITSGDYSRQTLGGTGMSAASSGATSNPGSVTWTANAAAATYTFTHASIWDAATSGNCLFVGQLAVPETVVASGVISFTAGKLLATLV